MEYNNLITWLAGINDFIAIGFLFIGLLPILFVSSDSLAAFLSIMCFTFTFTVGMAKIEAGKADDVEMGIIKNKDAITILGKEFGLDTTNASSIACIDGYWQYKPRLGKEFVKFEPLSPCNSGGNNERD